MNELKPCPFCGGEEIHDIAALPTDDPLFGQAWIVCKNCGASGSVFDFKTDITEIEKHWNTRHIPGGYALVPVEPDDEMQLVGAESVRIDTTPINKLFTANRVYKAMIKTA